MDAHTRRRVFEPFFTTKMNVGSGLGLSTAYAAVTRWGGEMEVESRPDEGTTFTIQLPVWTGPVAQETATEAGGARQVRRARVLVVDDNEDLCNLLSRLFGRYHEVETALDGKAALAVFAPGKYDVVLIDLGMPGMAGDRVALEMRRADPTLASVLITGWEVEDGDARISRFDFQIQKPFRDIETLVDVVAQAVALHDRRAEEAGGRGKGTGLGTMNGEW